MPAFKDPEQGPTPLHRLLLRVAPVNWQGNRSLLSLMQAVGYSRSSMGEWIEKQRVTPAVAQKIIDYDRARPEAERANVTREDFEPFVYNT